jgi:hypothetical protein
MKRVPLTLLALLLAVPTFAYADEASKRVKIEDLIRVTKMDALLNQAMAQMSAQMKAMSEDQTPTRSSMTPAQQKLADDFDAKVQKIITDAVSWDKLKPVMIQSYADTYTEEELDGILAFYHSPAGQAMLAKNPQLMSHTVELVQKQMIDLQPQLEQATKDYVEQLKKQSSPPTAIKP